MFPIFGVIDDILILVASVILFMVFGPILKFSDSLKNENPQKDSNRKKNVVEGEYRIIKENKDTD